MPFQEIEQFKLHNSATHRSYSGDGVTMFDDPIGQWLITHGIAVTRESSIKANYLQDEWTAEHEAELPEVLQQWR